MSVKDGYRPVLSASELFDGSDTIDFLLIDRNESTEDGRYILLATPDFYVDRNVETIVKMEFALIKERVQRSHFPLGKTHNFLLTPKEQQ